MFGLNMKRLRESKGMTQRDLAVKLDVSETQISRWEKGARPALATALSIAAVLETTVEDLMAEPTAMEPAGAR